MPISLSEVADYLEGAMDGCTAFLHCTTGEIVVATEDDLYRAEGPLAPGLPPWQAELLTKLREISESENWIEIPRNDTSEDYRVMERFCEEACPGEVQEALFESIDGKGAFRRFREAVTEHGLREEWYRFRTAVIRELAAAWLEEQGVEFQE